MDHQLLSDKMELQELANKLFMYVDAQDWNKILDEVFSEEVWFDMQSAGGGEPATLAASEIGEMWRKGFEGLDAVHHQAGHYLIEVKENEAGIFGYAMAAHYKKKAQKGNTRMFVGSYDLKAKRTADGWRLHQFKYNLKFIDGNTTLE
jgi:hypothetical protein